MSLIKQTTPINLHEEKELFFQSDSYNPVFKYKRSFTKEELTQWGLPQQKFFDHAKQMLEMHGAHKLNHETTLSQEEIKNTCAQLFNQLKIKPLDIHFSDKYISRVMINNRGLFFRSPLILDLKQLQNTLDHEIQTHLLRKLNDQLQPWSDKEKQEIDFRQTEEGLSSLHSYLHRDDKIMRKTYFNYFAAFLSKKSGFRDVYNQLLEFKIDPQLAWNITVKKKRGLIDTSKPGGLTKDIVYFHGAVKVWSWIMDTNNNPHDLYLGRIGLKEIEKVKNLKRPNNLVFPTFFDNIEKYKQKIREIGQINNFESLL